MQENRAAWQRIGTRIRELREQRGLTLERLAESADVTPQHLGIVERGQTNVTIDFLAAVAAPLSVDLSVLVPPESDAQAVDVGPTPEELSVIAQALRIADRYLRNRR